MLASPGRLAGPGEFLRVFVPAVTAQARAGRGRGGGGAGGGGGGGGGGAPGGGGPGGGSLGGRTVDGRPWGARWGQTPKPPSIHHTPQTSTPLKTPPGGLLGHAGAEHPRLHQARGPLACGLTFCRWLGFCVLSGCGFGVGVAAGVSTLGSRAAAARALDTPGTPASTLAPRPPPAHALARRSSPPAPCLPQVLQVPAGAALRPGLGAAALHGAPRAGPACRGGTCRIAPGALPAVQRQGPARRAHRGRAAPPPLLWPSAPRLAPFPRRPTARACTPHPTPRALCLPCPARRSFRSWASP
jgi:hypothetical protein